MIDLTTLDKHRLRTRAVTDYYGWAGDGTFGVFSVPSLANGRRLHVIASSGDGWEHVSVSKEKKPPTWAEMEQIKRLFFAPNEVCMQLHVAVSDHISVHPNCLHIWRPIDVAIPLPPKRMVG